MQAALVSTYPPTKCGIANYSQNLARALRREGLQVTVLAEEVKSGEVEEGTQRIWKRDRDWVAEVLARLDSLRPDLVHVQHEESILGQDARLPRLLRGAHNMGIATAVTLHSVYGGALGVPGIRYSGRRFQQAIGEHADRIIVHQIDGCQDRLWKQGIARDKVLVIPHGTSTSQLVDRHDARSELGLDGDARLILAMGFIHKKKGLHTLIEALPAVQSEIPEVQLLIAGSFRTHPWDLLYNKRLRRSMEPGLRDGSVELREGFQSSESMHTMLSAADVLALPYRQAYGSASGVLHLAAGAGAPVLCADGYKFAEAKRAWGDDHPTLFPPAQDPNAWATALCDVLSSPELLEDLATRSRALGEDTSWHKVAHQHIAGFKEALASRSAAAA